MNIFQRNPRLYNWVLLLVVVLALFGASFIWSSQYNPFNPSVSFTTGKSRTIMRFTEDFISRVLLVTEEVDVATQIELEQRLHDLKDKELDTAWDEIIAADNEAVLQRETSEFLLLLTKKARQN